MKSLFRNVAVTLLLLAVSSAACAKSTTAVAVSLVGKAIPGQTAYLHVTLTGSHYVYAGGCSFFPGSINLSKDGAVVNTTNPDTYNSNVTKQEVVPAAPGTGCYDQSSGMYYAVKVFGDLTDYVVPFQLPSGRADYQFAADFSGDGDSNGSSSGPINVSARYPDDSAIISYIIMN